MDTAPSSSSRLHLAAAAGDEALVRQLLLGGAAPKAQDDQGLTALHKAATAGHAAVVKLLLACEPLSVPELQVAICMADVFGRTNVLAVLFKELARHDMAAATAALEQVAAQGPRATQHLVTAMLSTWLLETADVDARRADLGRQQQELGRQQQELVGLRLGVQHLVLGLAAQAKQQAMQKQGERPQAAPGTRHSKA